MKGCDRKWSSHTSTAMAVFSPKPKFSPQVSQESASPFSGRRNNFNLFWCSRQFEDSCLSSGSSCIDNYTNTIRVLLVAASQKWRLTSRNALKAEKSDLHSGCSCQKIWDLHPFEHVLLIGHSVIFAPIGVINFRDIFASISFYKTTASYQTIWANGKKAQHKKNINLTPNSHLVAEKSTLKFIYSL